MSKDPHTRIPLSVALSSGCPDSLNAHPASFAQKADPCASAHADELLTTGEMARRSGNTLRTVRFYEEAGLLTPADRSQGGHRLFSPRQLQKLLLITDLREAGLSLESIRALFELKQQCESPEEAAIRMSELLGNHVREMKQRIEVLSRLQQELNTMVALIQECKECDDQNFPSSCKGCDLPVRPDIPRLVGLLWSDRDPTNG